MLNEHLEIEMETYRQQLPALSGSAGHWVAIRGEEVIGVFDTYPLALQAAYAAYGLDAFLVNWIEAPVAVVPVTRDFWHSPTLEELAEQQGVKPVHDLNSILGGWPGDVDDGFEEHVLELRRAGMAGSGE